MKNSLYGTPTKKKINNFTFYTTLINLSHQGLVLIFFSPILITRLPSDLIDASGMSTNCYSCRGQTLNCSKSFIYSITFFSSAFLLGISVSSEILPDITNDFYNRLRTIPTV